MLTTDDRRQLTIGAESVTIEAVSSGFSALRRPSGETIVGIPTVKPLGWDGEYYRAESTNTRGGVWIVEKGSDITTHITSANSMTVQEALKSGEKAFLIFMIVLVALCVWLLGCLIVPKN